MPGRAMPQHTLTAPPWPRPPEHVGQDWRLVPDDDTRRGRSPRVQRVDRMLPTGHTDRDRADDEGGPCVASAGVQPTESILLGMVVCVEEFHPRAADRHLFADEQLDGVDAVPHRDMKPRRIGRRLLVVAVIVAVVAFAATTRSVIATAIAGLTLAAVPAIAFGVALSFVAMANRGMMNTAAHRAVGLPADLISMIRISSIGFAANKIIRTGGASGLAVFIRHGRRRGFHGGTVAAACIVASLSSLAALGFLLAVTVALLAVSGRLTGWWLAAGTGFALYVTAIGGLAIIGYRGRNRLERLLEMMRRVRSRFGRRAPKLASFHIDHLFSAFADAGQHLRWFGRSVAHAVASKALGAAMLLAAVVAAGISLPPAGVVVVYATALAVSFVAVVPGGLGVVEVTTTAMLTAGGADLAAAAVAVALFRVFDMWLPVVTGAVLGRRELDRQQYAPRTETTDVLSIPLPPAMTEKRPDRFGTARGCSGDPSAPNRSSSWAISN